MTNDTETISKTRIVLVTMLALSFLVSQLASLSFATQITRLSDGALDWIDNIGFAIMIMTVLAGSWVFMSVTRRASHVKEALNDELTEHNLRMAAVFAFKLVFLLSMGLFVLTKLIPLSGEDIARLILTACLVGSYLRFAFLESRNA